MRSDNLILEAAIQYTTRGWPVLPIHSAQSGVCSCGNQGLCKSPGKHPRTAHGYLDSTTDPDTIRQWFERWRDLNIGVATGVRSGVFVLDVDYRHNGDESLQDLERLHGKLPSSVEALTGGGRHIYFQCSDDNLSCSNGEIAPGLDIKANGGYVVAPPSLHPSGKHYAWEASSHIEEVQVVSAPSWLLELAKTKQRLQRDWKAAFSEKIFEGKRNITVASLAGHLLRKSVDPYVVLELLFSWNKTHANPDMTDKEVFSIVQNIARRELVRRQGGRRG